jgi:hypothetical protein
VPSSFQVLFGAGAEPGDEAFYDLLTSLEVEENADLPGAIQLTMPIATEGPADAENFTVVGDDLFAPYARIAVVVSVDNKPDACIFDGYVLSHRIHLDRGTTGSSVQVWGQDVSCLMNLEEKVHEWLDTDATIANTIFQNYQFSQAPANTSDDSRAHTSDLHSVMQRATDAQFLRDRARRAGKLFRVCCDQKAGSNTGYFIKPDLEAEPTITLTLNPPEDSNVDTLDFEWDVARPTEVVAHALVMSTDAVDGSATESGLKALDERSLAAFTGEHVMTTRLAATVDDVSELQARAASLLREAGWFVKCEGETDVSRLGAVMRVGTLAQIDGAGTLHSGKYFVWSVRHSITAHSHRMKFVLVRNAVGAY